MGCFLCGRSVLTGEKEIRSDGSPFVIVFDRYHLAFLQGQIDRELGRGESTNPYSISNRKHTWVRITSRKVSLVQGVQFPPRSKCIPSAYTQARQNFPAISKKQATPHFIPPFHANLITTDILPITHSHHIMNGIQARH